MSVDYKAHFGQTLPKIPRIPRQLINSFSTLRNGVNHLSQSRLFRQQTFAFFVVVNQKI